MADRFCTESVMESIKKEIEDRKIPIKRQYLASEYYEKRMKEYKKQDEIVIFGSGNYGRDLYKMMIQEGIQSVRCFCDNGAARQHKQLSGLEILSPDEAIEKFPNAMYIVTPKGYGDEIMRQLVGMGIDVRHISIFTMELTGLEEFI